MKLVNNWRDALKWHSTQVFALLALLPLLWEEVPYEVKALVPDEYNKWIIAVLAVIGMIARMRKQSYVPAD
jgi:hypothetical protein